MEFFFLKQKKYRIKRLSRKHLQTLQLNSFDILILFLFCLNKKETIPIAFGTRTTLPIAIGTLRAFVRPSHRRAAISLTFFSLFNYLNLNNCSGGLDW